MKVHDSIKKFSLNFYNHIFKSHFYSFIKYNEMYDGEFHFITFFLSLLLGFGLDRTRPDKNSGLTFKSESYIYV